MRLTGLQEKFSQLWVMSPEQVEVFRQRGEYDLSFAIPHVGRYRVNVFRQQGAVALAFRLVATKVPSPEELGVLSSIIELSQRKRGLVLVTGPTGSGKSHQIANIMQTNRRMGMITMDDAIVQLVREGRITGQMAVSFAQCGPGCRMSARMESYIDNHKKK